MRFLIFFIFYNVFLEKDKGTSLLISLVYKKKNENIVFLELANKKNSFSNNHKEINYYKTITMAKHFISAIPSLRIKIFLYETNET
ncbi:hypothetical protein BpHYR1_011531 [Brachionus plicatilis]|uniref:Uncharacterized protein n=1 Tax=Brachionus plicatilis TaxID=10195 RepID=A0A3M7R037_BRAPC|nr:hypothetical protein BpHYR1_011531 [Brachionus plicatilis]